MSTIISDTPVIVVILAHPDDESFPMGGTLAKYATGGARVVLLTATLGEAGIEGLSPADTARIRRTELDAAASTLGIAEVHVLGYRDGEVAQANQEAAVAEITVWLHHLQPQVVITFGPDGISGHPDHIAVHRFVTQAFDRVAGEAEFSNARQMRLFYLAHSKATEQGCSVSRPVQQAPGPVAAIDVSNHLVTKVRAAQCHASQQPPFAGTPEEEAAHLACHEAFALARPIVDVSVTLDDLFAELPVPEPYALRPV